MASAYRHETALKIYEAIAPSGSTTNDLMEVVGLARNTILIYCREMEKRGLIRIEATRSSPPPLQAGGILNLYFPIAPPLPTPSPEAEKLQRVEQILQAVLDRGKSATKQDLQNAIQQAIAICGKEPTTENYYY